MAKSKKKAAISTLKKEIARQRAKMRRALRRANAVQRKRLRLTIKRLDAASHAISLVFDDKTCLAFDDSNCTIFVD